MGQANTLNRGWEMARGSLIGYLSSDDRLEPSAISKLVTALSMRPDAAVAYCDFELIDAQGRGFRIVQAEEFSQERLCVDLVCQPGPGALFRRDVFDRTGGWAGHLRHVPDFEFWLRASRFGPFVRVPHVISHYRIHEGSASFRPTTAERSMEIVKVMSAYWGGQTGLQAHRSMATAYLIAAKSHAQSGRFGAAIHCATLAVKFNRRLVFRLSFWRAMLSGMLRRFIYKLRLQT